MRTWRGEWTGADGRPRRQNLGTDRTAAEEQLAELVRRALRGDPYEEHRKRPLAEHLADWERDLHAGGEGGAGAGAKHVRQTVACARRVLEGCGFVFMADLAAPRVNALLAELRRRGPAVELDPAKAEYSRAELAKLLRMKTSAVTAALRRHKLAGDGQGKARRYPRATAEALAALRGRGRSIKTSNLHLAAVKQFCRWLVQARRMPDSPLEHLAGGNVKLDRRHDRRALAPAELAAILRTALGSARAFRGLAGRDRHFLYLAAMTTGYRAGELASLTPECFALDGEAPEVTLAAAFTKNRRAAAQPLPPAIAAALAGYLADKPAGQLVWPGGWPDDAAAMLREDLEPAGIPYAIDSPGGPLFADFHALRHSYIALLDRAGATLKEAMQLARHSDPKLTMAVYGRAQPHDLAGAVADLPGLLPAAPALAATGTTGAPASAPEGAEGKSLPFSCARPDRRTRGKNAGAKRGDRAEVSASGRKALTSERDESGSVPMIAEVKAHLTRSHFANDLRLHGRAKRPVSAAPPHSCNGVSSKRASLPA